MDMDFLRAWFRGFETSLESMGETNLQGALAGCARECAESCPLKMYRESWEKSQGDLGRFFRRLNEAEGISVQKGDREDSWRVIYTACGCDLVAEGLVRSRLICECSRLSLEYCLEETVKGHSFRVVREKSVLGGDECCCFLVVRAGGDRR